MAFHFWPALIAVAVLTFSIGFAVWRWDLGLVLSPAVRWLRPMLELVLSVVQRIWTPPAPVYDAQASYEPQRSRTRSFLARLQQRDPLNLSPGAGLRLAV